jgi:hypothetical protein
VTSTLSGSSPEAPGPLSDSRGAPILVDRSRPGLPSAKDVLANR